jgi:hypothetical protein
MDERQHSRVFEREIILSESIDAGIAIDPLQFEIVPSGAKEAGDFNQNGAVDAADYVVWRTGLGMTYTQADYELWRAHFGETVGSNAVLRSAEPLSVLVPEPSTVSILFVSVLALVAHGRIIRLRLRH